MTGVVAGKEAGNQTHDEEPTSAGENFLLQVPRCIGLYGFSADLDVVQCRINGGVPEVVTQSPTTWPPDGNEFPFHPYTDLGTKPLAQDLS
ncbi:hypothetical protein Ancab_010635, partial [Ancistrocladus abbreviatus]